MTLDEIKEHLDAAGLVPVFVNNEPPGDNDRLTLSGGLPEYLHAVQAVGAKVVIVYSQKFVEGFFLYDPNESNVESAGSDEEDEEVLDLSVGNKGLRQFKEGIRWPKWRYPAFRPDAIRLSGSCD